MKMFVLRSLYFSALFFIPITVFITGLRTHLVTSYAYNFPSNITTLVVGNSHAECSIKPIPEFGLYNAAASGEHLAYTLGKLRIILRQNPSVKTVLLEFSNIHFDPSNASNLWEDKYITNKFPTFYPLLKPQELSLILSNAPNQLVKGFGGFVLRGSKKVITKQYKLNKYGGFRSLNHVYVVPKTKSALEVCENYQPLSAYERRLQNVNLQTFKSIVDLCNSNKVQLIVLRSPTHPNLKDDRYEKDYNLFFSNADFNLPYLDQRRAVISSDGYADRAHLNQKGATEFTSALMKILKSGGPNWWRQLPVVGSRSTL